MYDIKLTDSAGNSTIMQIGTNYRLIEDAAGNKIPVPNGFSPIKTPDQGTLETGFVIKNDTDGNEFVWVPVKGMGYNYDRVAWTGDNIAYVTDGTDEATKSTKIKYSTSISYYFKEEMLEEEKTSVETYGGFYIGRYESGIIGYDSNVNTSNSNSETNWTGYSNGTAVIQKGKQVWNYITRDKAKEIAESMYSTKSNVTSKLCSSYAWDTALKFIETQNSTYPTNSVGGYYDASVPSATGYDTVHPCNIYDLGGNVFEWTTEGYSVESASCTVRGGGYTKSANTFPAAHRDNAATHVVLRQRRLSLHIIFAELIAKEYTKKLQEAL